MCSVYYRAMLLGLVLIGLASISWGTTGATMTVLARDTGIGPLLVGWARLAVAAPCLVLAALASAQLSRRHAPADRSLRAGAREAAWFVPLGLSMAAYQACFFWAVTLTGVAVAALIAICSAPLLIAVLATLVLGERPAPAVRASLGLAVVGTALLVIGPRGLGEVSGHFGIGALLALGAGLSYAVYAVAAKRVLARVAPLTAAAMTFALAAIFLTPALLFDEHAGFAALASGWPLLVYLGVGPTAVAYALFAAGLRRVTATAAGIASLLEPLTASLLGVFAFGETLGALGVAGALLLLSAFALLVLSGPGTR